jgi:hypothetical protein
MDATPFPLTPGIGSKGLAPLFPPHPPPSSALIGMRRFRLRVLRNGPDSEMILAESFSQYTIKK